MSRSPLEHAFAHHVWATVRILDACASLRPDQLSANVPSTDRSILYTARHMVGGDAWYLFFLTGDRALVAGDDSTTRTWDPPSMDLPALRATMASHAAVWSTLLSSGLDPDKMVKEVDPDDGYTRDAPVGIRLAQALHHGTDHRSQISTALTLLGVRPPSIDVWDYGVETGHITEVYPAS
jgi:uncharacterized damage-inducible protein DinB